MFMVCFATVNMNLNPVKAQIYTTILDLEIWLDGDFILIYQENIHFPHEMSKCYHGNTKH